MAQTRKASARRPASSKRTSAKASTKSNGSSASKTAKGSNGSSRAKGSKAPRGSSKAGSQAKAASQASTNGAGSPGAVKEAVKSGVEGAAAVVRKAKVPLVASGAAVAGVAGAVVLSRAGGKSRKVLGVKVPKRSKLSRATKKGLANVNKPSGKALRGDARKIAGAVNDAAQRADHLGQRVSSVANVVQRVSETASDAAKKAK